MVYIDGKTDPSGKSQTSFSYNVVVDGKTLLISSILVKDMDITDAAGYINDSRDTLIFRALTEASAARLKMFLELLQLTE
jgi:signal peptidase I